MVCMLPGSTVHEISQTRILERVANSSPRGSPHVSYIAGRFSSWEVHLTWNLCKGQILPLVVYAILYPYVKDLYTKENETLFNSYLSIPSFLHFSQTPQFSSVQFSSLSCVQLFCDPMNRSTPGLPVHQQLPEFTQTHIHRVRDAIQPSSHPLLSPSPPAPNPSQHQSLFQWVNSLQEVAKVLEFQL